MNVYNTILVFIQKMIDTTQKDNGTQRVYRGNLACLRGWITISFIRIIIQDLPLRTMFGLYYSTLEKYVLF